MRNRRNFPLLLLLPLLAACQTPGGSTTYGSSFDEGGAAAGRLVRITFKQYYGNSKPLVMENLAGRDVVALRSQALKPGESPVAYVPDEVMRELLKEFRRSGYFDHAGPRPPDPSRYGVGELRLDDAQHRTVTFVRQRRPNGEVTDSYRAQTRCWSRCTPAFLAVYNHHGPTLQATTSRGDFGTKRVDR